MNKLILSFLFCCMLAATCNISLAQDTTTAYPTVSTDSLTKGEYTLLFINKETALDATVKQRLTDAFFTVYPKEAGMYNKNTSKKVTFIIDPAYDGVAATGGDVVRFNPEWF